MSEVDQGTTIEEDEEDSFYGPGVSYEERQRQIAELRAEEEGNTEEITLPVPDGQEFGDAALDAMRERFAPETPAEARALAAEVDNALRHGDVGVPVSPRIPALFDQLFAASASRTLPQELRDEAMLGAGAVARWLTAELDDRLDPGSVIATRGSMTPDGGSTVETTFSRGGKRVVTRTAEEVQRLRTELEEAERESEEFGIETRFGGRSVTPEQAASWSAEKWLRFKDQHPQAAEQILQGKTVSGI